MDSTATHDDLVYCWRCYDWHRKGQSGVEHYERNRLRIKKLKEDAKKAKRDSMGEDY